MAVYGGEGAHSEAYAQIGHGGRGTDARDRNYTSTDYDDKVGDIFVSAGTFEQALDHFVDAFVDSMEGEERESKKEPVAVGA